MPEIINIYCDESCHLENDGIPVMSLGAVYCPDEKKREAFRQIQEIKQKHGLKPHFEMKWTKVSQAKIDFYLEIIDYFFDSHDLGCRILVVPDKTKLKHETFQQTHDKFYYKMYFSMLKVVLSSDNIYNIYLDIKDSQGAKKIQKLHDIISNDMYDFNKQIVNKIQLIRSHEVELMGLVDLLIGSITYVNRGLSSNPAKIRIIEKIREKSKFSLTKNTLPTEKKLNIFIWKPKENI